MNATIESVGETQVYSFRVPLLPEEMEALEHLKKSKGQSKGHFAAQAIREKLQRDGNKIVPFEVR